VFISIDLFFLNLWSQCLSEILNLVQVAIHSFPYRTNTPPCNFQNWIETPSKIQPVDIPNETAVIIYPLFFPENDVRPKYDMQEPRLSQHLSPRAWCIEYTGERCGTPRVEDQSDSLGC